jgi:hypothetical protein
VTSRDLPEPDTGDEAAGRAEPSLDNQIAEEEAEPGPDG